MIDLHSLIYFKKVAELQHLDAATWCVGMGGRGGRRVSARIPLGGAA